MSEQSVDGATLRRIQTALIQAYPHKGDLQQLLLFELNLDLPVGRITRSLMYPGRMPRIIAIG